VPKPLGFDMREPSLAQWAYIHALLTPSPGQVITWKVVSSDPFFFFFLKSRRVVAGANPQAGAYKRAITLGIVIGWGNLNGIVSSNIYRGTDAPYFYPGHATVLAYLTVFLLGGSILQYILLRIENRKRLLGQRDHWTEGLNAQEINLLGDRRPDFLYTL
jgi:hypothetical protein